MRVGLVLVTVRLTCQVEVASIDPASDVDAMLQLFSGRGASAANAGWQIRGMLHATTAVTPRQAPPQGHRSACACGLTSFAS
jgi:hypothetical protein